MPFGQVRETFGRVLSPAVAYRAAAILIDGGLFGGEQVCVQYCVLAPWHKYPKQFPGDPITARYWDSPMTLQLDAGEVPGNVLDVISV